MWKKLFKSRNTQATDTSLKQSPTQDTAPKEASKETYLQIERERIEGTPFLMVGSKQDGWCLTLGKHRLTNMLKSKKEVIKQMKAKDWNLLTSIMMAFVYDRDLIDKALSKDTSIHPEDKARETEMTF